jgi:hypothetical protein
MPPPWATDVAVDQSAEAPAEPLAAPADDELPAAAAVALEVLELLHPAASMIDPTAAAVATIAFDARKVKPSHARPQGFQGASVGILARQVASWPSGLNGR